MNLNFDATNPKSIEEYAKRLIGMTFSDVCNADQNNEVVVISDEYKTSHEDRKRKGGLGDLIEERYFHYRCNSDSRPDFPDAGVELKVTPYKTNKNGTLSAKERLVITMIDYFKVVNEPFESSHLWNKSRLILLIYYLYQADIKNRLDYRINYAQLFTPPASDLVIIKQDYEKIISKIKAGKAHELSEGDTMYLGAATKGATSSATRKQPYSNVPAKQRAFCFKNSYMTYVLNNYIIPGKETYEPIIKGNLDVNFEVFINNKISEYKGYTISALCERFGIDVNKNPKNLEAMLAYRMLGIKSSKAEEFEKANIVVKSIRIRLDGKIDESMSFPSIDFKLFANENWEDSYFYQFFSETKFLFVIYKQNSSGEYAFKNSMFWNMSALDLEEASIEWKKIQTRIIEGVTFKLNKNGTVSNDIPNKKENRIIHMRPHATKAAYKLNNGYCKGNIRKDGCELPDGQWMTKQSFWLNNDYILEQIENEQK